MLGFAVIRLAQLLLVAVVVLVPLVLVTGLLVALVRSGRDAQNPNLAPCPDCRRRVSLQADTCPHCGCPLSAS